MKNLSIIFTLSVLLAACGQNSAHDSGDEFVGKWKTVKGMGGDVVIAKNGDGFTVDDTHSRFPATLKDGGLHFSAGLGTVDLAIDKASGHLLMAGNELERVSK
jgi:hypothetical protein